MKPNFTVLLRIMTTLIRHILFGILWLSTCQASAQTFNTIYKYEQKNSLVTDLYEVDEELVLPVFRYNEDSVFLDLHFDILNDSEQLRSYPIRTGRTPLIFSDESMYITGEDAIRSSNEIRFIRLNTDFDIIWNRTYPNLIGRTKHLSATVFGDNVVAAYSDSDEFETFQVLCVDPDGELLWQREYGFNSNYVLGWDMEAVGDHLFIPLTYIKENELFSNNGMMVLDRNGDVKKVIDLKDSPYWSSDAHDLTVLDDGRILMEASLKYDSLPFNQFHKLYWFDQDGKLLDEQRIDRPRGSYLDGVNVKAGRDCFYLYGNYEDVYGDDIFYGFITKYTNEGDTIWHHLYHHPEFADGSASLVYIWDLIEAEDGSLTVMGELFDGAANIWLMRLNSDGCLSTDCETKVITATHDYLPSEAFSISPNPASDYLNVSCEEEVAHLSLYSLNGELFSTSSGTSTVDVSEIPAGMYVLQIVTESGKTGAELVVVRKN